jgi:transposase InsO family protein
LIARVLTAWTLYNTIRPHQALADRTPAQVYTAPGGGAGLVSA